ncbi:DUF559 domain-containing protein [Escherichia coli]|uniref:endonuclease domain-containing protein n=1 Tax=Escherichia coli TaxID=562 RepID=UPI002880103E|nr:DUF559 domain-containing protein [Escherichia coli]
MRKKLTFFGTIVLLLLCYVIYPCVWPVAGMILYVAYITIVGFDKKNKSSSKPPIESSNRPSIKPLNESLLNQLNKPLNKPLIKPLTKPLTKPSDERLYGHRRGLLAWWQTVDADAENWLDIFCKGCESPAEEAFLRKMVAEFNLKPKSGMLVSPDLVLEMQVPYKRYRFDFVVNGRQIIEIDGAAWHSSPEQIERDRIRDEYSIKEGFMVLRIPAKTVLKTPNVAIEQVKKTLEKTPSYTMPVRQSVINQQPLAKFSFVKLLSDINNNVNCQMIKHESLFPFRVAIAMEKRQLEMIVSEIESEVRVASMLPQDRMLYENAMSHLEKLLQNDDLNYTANPTYQWDKITKPSPVENQQIQESIDREYKDIMKERELRLAKLSQRCKVDPIFSMKFRDKLKMYNYPTITDIFK